MAILCQWRLAKTLTYMRSMVIFFPFQQLKRSIAANIVYEYEAYIEPTHTIAGTMGTMFTAFDVLGIGYWGVGQGVIRYSNELSIKLYTM